MGSKRAATLIEMLVYMVLAILIFGLAFSIFRFARFTGASASSSFVLGQDAALSFEKLRRDFIDTSLQSIRVFTPPTSGSSWIAMANARDDQGVLQISRYGTPEWRKFVAYELQPDSDNDGVAKLVRFEVEQSFRGRAPLPLDKPLTTPATGSKVVLQQVLAPGWESFTGPDGMVDIRKASGANEGGFVVRFVRRNSDGSESLSALNPNQNDDSEQPDWSVGSTLMVDVQVTLVERNTSTGKVSLIQVPLRITPRN